MTMFSKLLTISCLLLALSVLSNALNAQEILIEAEDGTLQGTNVLTEPSGYSGTGFVSGFSSSSDSVSMAFEAPAAGVYQFSIGYRTPGGEKGFAGSINGLGFSGMFPASTNFAEIAVGKVVLETARIPSLFRVDGTTTRSTMCFLPPTMPTHYRFRSVPFR